MAPNGRPAGCGPAPPGWLAPCATAQSPLAGINHQLQSQAQLHAEVLPWPPARSPTTWTTRSAVTMGIHQIGPQSRNRCTRQRVHRLRPRDARNTFHGEAGDLPVEQALYQRWLLVRIDEGDEYCALLHRADHVQCGGLY